MRRPLSLAALALAVASNPAAANPFTSTAAIDAAVAEFLGVGAGAPGGAARPVDTRLKLASCTGGMDVAWYGRGGTSLQVSCPARGWRVFVPVGGAVAPNARAARSAEPVVNRGETVSVVFEGRGFLLTRHGEALEAGAQGEWIKIKPTDGKAQPIRAQVLRPGAVRVSAD